MRKNYPAKKTPLNFAIHPLIEKRWSPVAFSNEPIEDEKINSLFEALRWAPSSFNEQPWRIIYAVQKDKEEFDRLSSLLTEGNSWAKNAYILILVCSIPKFSYNAKPNRHYAYDSGAAMENLFLQAVSMDLMAHEMEGFDREKAHQILGVPNDIEPITMMAVGYHGDTETLSEKLKERESSPRSRKPFSEIIFKGRWPN